MTTTSPALPDGIRLTTLPNGVRVASEHMPGVRSVSVGCWVGVGSRDELPPLEGATHFLEHLLFKGTENRSALEIAQVLEAVGGDMNAFTAKEYTAYYARCLDRDLPQAVALLGEMLTTSTIPPEEVENERDVVLEEIRMHLDDPGDLVHAEFGRAYYGDHALGREILGSEQSMTAMTRDQVAGWWRQRYTSDVITMAVAGNVDHDALVADVELVLGDLAPGDRPGDEPGPAPQTPALPLLVRTRPTEQAHLVIGGNGLARGHDLRWAQAVLNQALGGGMASRLFQEVREKRGLAYSVYSYPAAYTNAGTFAVYAGTTPSKAAEVIEVIKAEIAKVLAEGLSTAELAQAKGYLAGSTLLALEDTSSRMTRLGRALTTATPLLGLDQIMAAIEDVTPGDVAEVAGMLLGAEVTVAAVGPIHAADLAGVI
ncbi:MAG TPA: pitrilysin family protein [Euzebya sp.]|nr:pitrilysin family protein [Euzebya sp.]